MTDGDELGRKALDRKFDDLAGLRQRNAEKMEHLAQRGLAVNLLPLLVDAMVNALFPEGTQERYDFLSGWELKVAAILEDLDAEARRAALLAPGVVPNGHRG